VIVLDSSFLVAYHNERDAHHPAARDCMEKFLAGQWGRGLLLEYVFLEVVTVLLSRRGPRVAAAVAGVLLNSEELEFVPCSDFFLETLDTFREQPGTALSFADAAIAITARHRAEGLVATFDADFRRSAGITVVPA
jgi:predicted nucleic acid-binding protein